MISFFKKYKSLKKKNFKQLLKTVLTGNATSHKLAMGLAVGVFFSILPTFGVGMIISLLLAWYKKWNVISTYFGTLITNPFNATFIYFFDYKLGNWIINGNQTGFLTVSWQSLKDIALELYLGGFILACFCSIVLYFLLYGIAEKYKQNRAK